MARADFDARLKTYLELVSSRPELFRNPPHGVRILLDSKEIEAVENSVARDLETRGLPPEGARVGLVLRDPWFYVLRDAVEFPDGSRRMHARILNNHGGGSAILPMIAGKIVLLRHFRHPLRSTILEFPRGGIEPGCSPEDSARAEIREEIGGTIKRIELIGFVHGMSHIFAGGVHLFFAELDSISTPQIGEGIEAIEQFSVEMFENLVRQGDIVDSVTVATYTHAKLRNLI